MAKTLSYHEVAELAVATAQNLHMRIPSANKLLANMTRRNSMPLLFQDAGLQMWVDKYYIAYSSWDDVDVHYVYLTPAHISEEYASYQEARKSRKSAVTLPASIKKQFAEASRQMRDTQKKYAIFKIV